MQAEMGNKECMLLVVLLHGLLVVHQQATCASCYVQMQVAAANL